MLVSWQKCRCSHRSVAPHLRLVQRVCTWHHGGGQGAPEWGGAESHGDRKEGDLDTTAMHRGSCVLSKKKTEFNEDFVNTTKAFAMHSSSLLKTGLCQVPAMGPCTHDRALQAGPHGLTDGVSGLRSSSSGCALG